ncbi:MAG: HEAT repeat domain-containing protein [Pseudomonadota bacterium]
MIPKSSKKINSTSGGVVSKLGLYKPIIKFSSKPKKGFQYKLANSQKKYQKGLQKSLLCIDLPLKTLIKNLKTGNATQRYNAVEKIGNLGPKAKCAVSALVRAMFDADMGVQLKSRGVLKKMGASVIPEILKTFGEKRYEDMSLSLQMKISTLLVLIGRPGATQLLKALKDKREVVRETAAYVLSRVGAGAKNLPAILRALNDKRLYLNIAEALGRMSPSVSPHLIGRLNNNKWWVREGAAIALGRIFSKKNSRGRLRAVNVQENAGKVTIRYTTVQSRKTVSKRLTTQLKGLLSALSKAAMSDKNWRVRMESIRALGRIGIKAPMVLRAIYCGLKDGSWKVREIAAEAPYKLMAKDKKTIAHLLVALKDKVPGVRSSAVQTLGYVGRRNKKVGLAIRQMLKDPHYRVVYEARYVLKKMNK